jgi:hypothetical protein
MSTLNSNITGVILVGGKSRRMGRDKAFLEIGGKTLFEKILDVFSKNFSRIMLIGDRGERFTNYICLYMRTSFLGALWEDSIRVFIIRKRIIFLCLHVIFRILAAGLSVIYVPLPTITMQSYLGSLTAMNRYLQHILRIALVRLKACLRTKIIVSLTYIHG